MDLSQYKIPEKTKSKITNQRQELIKKFLDRLNASRDPKKYKPLSPAFVSMRMRSLTESELYQFYGTCNESKNFSSHWWWSTNPNNFK